MQTDSWMKDVLYIDNFCLWVVYVEFIFSKFAN